MSSIELNKAKAAEFMAEFAATGIIDLGRFTEDATWWTFWSGEVPIELHADRSGQTAQRMFAGPGRLEIDGVTAEGDKVAVEARGFQPLKNGRSYDNIYLWLITFRNGRISCLRAYFDVSIAEKAFAAAE